MATEKKIPSRIQQKHDVAANWAKATNFIPKKGEIIIYDAEYDASGEETQSVRFKIGDGSKTVGALPFAVIDGEQKINGSFYFDKGNSHAQSIVTNAGIQLQPVEGEPSMFLVGSEDAENIHAAFGVAAFSDATPSVVTIGSGQITEVQLGGDAGSAKQVFTSQGDGATPKWTSVVNSLNGNTGDITGIATTSQLDNKQDKITSSNKLSSSLVDGLGAAAEKAVDTVISANSTSANLPTSKAVEDRINAHSGIDKVGTITGVKMNGVSKGTSGVVDLGTVITEHQSLDGKQDKITSSNKLAASLVSGLAEVATSGSYNDLSNTPTIPAEANNGTLTIQKNGTNVTTFGANQSTNATANITVPTKVSEITNDSGFITSDGSVKSVIDYNDTSKKIKVGYAGTGISGDGIKYIAGYTAGDSESEAKIKDISKDALKSWLGYAAVATSGSYNDLSDKPSFDKLTRIQKQAYTGGDNTVKYFKLASFPVYNSGGNYASFIITGRMGGWQADNMSFVNMILYNRNGEGGGYINVANSAFFNLCDIVMYREEDGTSTAYLKVKSYYTFDINVNTYQATNVYTGTDDTPTGTLKWTASEQADRLAVSGGVAYVNGFTLPKQVEINGETVNPNSAGLINLGTGFAKAADLPIKSATLTGTTLYLTL